MANIRGNVNTVKDEKLVLYSFICQQIWSLDLHISRRVNKRVIFSHCGWLRLFVQTIKSNILISTIILVLETEIDNSFKKKCKLFSAMVWDFYQLSGILSFKIHTIRSRRVQSLKLKRFCWCYFLPCPQCNLKRTIKWPGTSYVLS